MTPKRLEELNIKIFGDGAEKSSILELIQNPLIKGFTTNPTLMRRAGVTDYAAFAKEILALVSDKPISFEVFADDFGEIERQARVIASWGRNVYVKIPITNTKGDPTYDLVRKLAAEGIKLNVTAILTLGQVKSVAAALAPGVPAVVSVFAGRIADTGVDPMPIMREVKSMLAAHPEHELLWASPRELLNIFHAEVCGTDIITVSPDVLKKLSLIGKDLAEYSQDTVKMFYDDGQRAGYKL